MSRIFYNHCMLENVALLTVPKAGVTSIRRAVADAGGRTRLGRHAVTPGLHRVAVVRNTFDRLVSCWLDKTHPRHAHKTRQLRSDAFSPGMAFERFLDAVCADPRANHHYYPQDEIVGDHDEWVELSFLPYWWRARFPRYPLPHLNRNEYRAPGYRRYYSPESRAQVEQAYRSEIALWSFRFEDCAIHRPLET